MKSSTLTAGIALFVTLAAIGGGLAAIKWSQFAAMAAQPPMPEPAEAVRLAAAREISWQPMSDLVGTAFSLRSVRMSNELPGTVAAVRFESGSIIDEGAVVVELDASTARADLAAAEAAVRVAEAGVAVGETRLDLATIELERIRVASEQNAATPIEADRRASEVEAAKAELLRLRAAVDQARSHVEQARVHLEKHTIRAPFRGRAGLRTVHEGQFLAEGTTFVLLEEVSDRIYLDFAIPQEYLARVRIGMKVLATSAALGPDPVEIEVVAIDATVSNDTRNVRVRGIVDNPVVEGGAKDGTQRLRAGMFLQVRVPVDAPQPRVVVPATAVRRTTYGDNVWIVAPGDTAKDPHDLRAASRPVRLGPAIGDDIIILDGLKAGEIVATTGSFKLREGAKVIDSDNPPPPPPGMGGNGAGDAPAH